MALSSTTTRVLVTIGVFVAGFGVGLGLVLLIAGRMAPAPPAAQPAAAPAAVAEPAAPPAAPAGAAAVAAPDAGSPSDVASPGAAAAPSPAGGAAEVTLDPVETPPAAAAAAPAALPPDAPWWQRAVGHECRVVLGRVNVLQIRDGSLTPDAVVDWQRDFGNRPKAGRLVASDRPKVLVHAVALDSEGLPIAAEITSRGAGAEIRGVICLRIGTQNIQLEPID